MDFGAVLSGNVDGLFNVDGFFFFFFRLMGSILECDSRTIGVCAVGVNVGVYDLHKEITLIEIGECVVW